MGTAYVDPVLLQPALGVSLCTYPIPLCFLFFLYMQGAQLKKKGLRTDSLCGPCSFATCTRGVTMYISNTPVLSVLFIYAGCTTKKKKVSVQTAYVDPVLLQPALGVSLCTYPIPLCFLFFLYMQGAQLKKKKVSVQTLCGPC